MDNNIRFPSDFSPDLPQGFWFWAFLAFIVANAVFPLIGGAFVVICAINCINRSREQQFQEWKEDQRLAADLQREERQEAKRRARRQDSAFKKR